MSTFYYYLLSKYVYIYLKRQLSRDALNSCYTVQSGDDSRASQRLKYIPSTGEITYLYIHLLI